MQGPKRQRRAARLLSPPARLAALAAVVLAAVSAVAQEPPSPTLAAPLTVTTRVEPQKVSIGTPFRYTIRVESGEEAEVVLPLLVDHVGEFLIVNFGAVPEQREKGKRVVESWYDLVGYAAGDKLVQGGVVGYRVAGSELRQVEVPGALIMVESLLPRSDGVVTASEVRDIKGPVRGPRDFTLLWLALAAVATAVLLGGGLYWLRARRRAVAAHAAPPRPAHEVALEALDRLRRAGLLEAGRHAEYYVELSAIVRTYLEARFRLRAPEMTTEEFLQAAQSRPELVAEHRGRLARFLAEADLVKFARHQPSLDESERAQTAARELVESTARRAEESDEAA